ncbi:hypothetical protein [Sphingomonas sp. IW22]|uniref:hypothetical protein n=1 Tax=Sphingomonas sp. IW22 TaxID=3242489 RepID=UPI0035225908
MGVDAGPGLGWGVLRRSIGNRTNDLREFLFGKLHPIQALRPASGWAGGWQPSATFDVLLPKGASPHLLDPKRLVSRHEDEAWPGIKDLACCVNIRIDKGTDVVSAYRRITGFAQDAFCDRRDIACVAVLHMPSESGVKRHSHVHLVGPARELDVATGSYGAFLRPFASDAGGQIIAAEWKAWR